MKTFPNRAGGGATRSPRSWLFAPGHDEKLLRLVFDVGADVVLLDLEDAVPLDCTIESARGVLAAFEIASAPACALLSYGGLDLAADLGIAAGEPQTLYARSYLVTAARGAGKPSPSDGVYPMLQDDAGLRREAEAARRLGFFGKSAIHPRQVPIIHEVFAATAEELEWARRVIAAFDAAGGAATRRLSMRARTW